MTIEITIGTEAQIAAAKDIQAKGAARVAADPRPHQLGAHPDTARDHWVANLAAFPAAMRPRGEEIIARWDELFAHAALWLDRALDRDIPTYIQTGKVTGALARIGFQPQA